MSKDKCSDIFYNNVEQRTGPQTTDIVSCDNEVNLPSLQIVEMGSYANICDKRIILPGPQKSDMVSCDTKVKFNMDCDIRLVDILKMKDPSFVMKESLPPFPNQESCEAEDELDCDIKKNEPSNIFYDWESIFAERRKQKEKEEKIIRELKEIAEKKRKSWELARLCKDFICKNSTKWVEDEKKRVHEKKFADEKKEQKRDLI